MNLIESNEIKSVEIDEISKLDIKNEDLTNLSIELFLDDEDWKKENVLSSPYKENDENDKSNFNMFDNSIRSVNKSIITISNSIYKINKSFILIVGGKSDSKTYKYDLENGVFEEKKELLLEKSDFNLVPYKNKILVLGGRRVIDQYEQIEDTIEIIDWRENNIKKLKNKLKTQRYSFGSAYINSCLFVLGGFNGKEVVNSNECFSKQTSKWEELQKMRVKKKEFSCVLVDKNLFIIGGSDEKENILKSCDKFDLETQKWTKIDDLIVPRKAGQCLLMPDGLYMIGGFDGNSYLKSCEKYEFSTKKWKSIAPMLQARSHFSANATSNYCYIYCFGGYDGKSLNSIERYDVMKQKWFNSGKLPNSKYRHQSIIIEDN